MPLDSTLKTAHVQAMVRKTWTGRQKTVVFVSNSSGIWSYTAQQVIFRKQEVIDPEVPDVSGASPKIKADAIMIVDIAISMVGVVYIADTVTATAGAVAAAQKFEVIESTPKGIIPGGTHYEVDLRCFRG